MSEDLIDWSTVETNYPNYITTESPDKVEDGDKRIFITSENPFDLKLLDDVDNYESLTLSFVFQSTTMVKPAVITDEMKSVAPLLGAYIVDAPNIIKNQFLNGDNTYYKYNYPIDIKSYDFDVALAPFPGTTGISTSWFDIFGSSSVYLKYDAKTRIIKILINPIYSEYNNSSIPNLSNKVHDTYTILADINGYN